MIAFKKDHLLSSNYSKTYFRQVHACRSNLNRNKEHFKFNLHYSPRRENHIIFQQHIEIIRCTWKIICINNSPISKLVARIFIWKFKMYYDSITICLYLYDFKIKFSDTRKLEKYIYHYIKKRSKGSIYIYERLSMQSLQNL